MNMPAKPDAMKLAKPVQSNKPFVVAVNMPALIKPSER
jgi:hypothetical protein